ncbi:MAG: tyrosine-protein phosphatase [Acidobacteria bacterium]|nr:tyrosine-protein phosphatase [Acidobacteriota bacterium]
MKFFLPKFSVIAVVMALLSINAFSQTEPRYAELPNFHQVNERLYRGAQPKKDGLKKLAALGVKSILNLRGEDENTQAEQREAQALGLNYFALPMGGLSRPSDEQITQALAIINNPENGVVFVHCQHGADRTGVVIACYRMSQESQTAAQAKAEAEKYGMSWVQFGMKRYISDYYKKLSREKQTPAGESQKAMSHQVQIAN